MGFLAEKCTMYTLTTEILDRCDNFSCGNSDLDDFFRNAAPLYTKNLLGKSYCYLLDDNPNVIVAIFTLSNDSVRVDHLPNSRRKKFNEAIPWEKRLKRYPAVLIGRLGVNTEYAHHGIGSELMDNLKLWFTEPDNKTACRFLAVDSYNIPSTIEYYKRNGFRFLFSTEEQEAENAELSLPLSTRYMYFDLIEVVEDI